MKIFITGSSGFIGTQLKARLLANSHTVIEMVNDLRDLYEVKKELLDAAPDVIVHLAAMTEVEKSFYNPMVFSQVNYVGTVNLIETAKLLPNLKNFVFASTMEVYGWQPISDLIRDGKEPDIIAFDEETQPNPNAPYAVAKYGCEKYLEYANRSYGLPYTILRQTNTYGRTDNDFFVTEQIITQMLKDPNEIKIGYAEPYRNFLYIDDLLDAWDMVINNEETSAGKLYCLGPDNAIKIKDYAQMIANKMDWRGNILWNQKPHRPGEIYLLNSTPEKIKRELGWEPKVDLSEGLDRTIEIWKKNIG